MGEYASVSEIPDWRLALLDGATRLPVAVQARNPIGWPGYVPRQAVSVWRLRSGAVAAAWDFSAFGGSFGEDDAAALQQAVHEAVRGRAPLLTLVRSGGTRLQEGMAALIGIPRARLALLDLAAAGLPHVSVPWGRCGPPSRSPHRGVRVAGPAPGAVVEPAPVLVAAR